jgi:hypothetical protein
MTSFTDREFHVPIGAEIFTSDGDNLGTVREIHGPYFKVDVPMQPDYWLPMASISSGAGNRVVLSFPKERLGDYKTTLPLAA